MRKRVELKIYGKVQGVFFRDSTRAKGEELHLSGWVRNEPDGTVQIVAEGADRDLNSMIEWCKYGPDHAVVEKVDVKWLEPSGESGGFKIVI